jgi:hypothetical protein
MARAREKVRIAKARSDLRNARKRLSSANKKTLPSEGRERDVVLKAQLAALESVNKAIRRLEVKLIAPARAKQHDIAKRPKRYREKAKSRFEAEVQIQTGLREIRRMKKPELSGPRGQALRLINEARAKGQDIKNVFRRIAAATGLSSHDIFTIFHYSTS